MPILSQFSLSGKIAVVTGGSRGIGRAVAVGLAEAGAEVIVTGRSEQALADTVRALFQVSGKGSAVVMDVSQQRSIDNAFSAIVERTGCPDILVNNAGVESLRPSLEVDESLWDTIVSTNLRGAFFCSRAFARYASAGESAQRNIVNLCSLTSVVGVPGAVPYGASKSGLVGVTRALAAEWALIGIRVNGIGPGYFKTEMTERFFESGDWVDQTLAKIPLKRFGDLDDLVGAAVFLSSDASRYITGQVIYVDGGYLASF